MSDIVLASTVRGCLKSVIDQNLFRALIIVEFKGNEPKSEFKISCRSIIVLATKCYNWFCNSCEMSVTVKLVFLQIVTRISRMLTANHRAVVVVHIWLKKQKRSRDVY